MFARNHSELPPLRKYINGDYEFGNGVMIEPVSNSMGKEHYHQSPSCERPRKVFYHPDRASGCLPIVQIHFLPYRSSLPARTGNPDNIPADEKLQIGIGCIEGFLLLAQALNARNYLPINGISVDEDFYLLAQTHLRFAAFLRQRCGFLVNIHDVHRSQAWILASAFRSEENMALMYAQLSILSALA